jgi:hypothetical protein
MRYAMGIRRLRNEQGGPIETLKPGDDPTAAVNKLYSYGRTTYGQKHPDTPRETTPKYKAQTPRDAGAPASYGVGKNSPVSPAPDEQSPQFRDDKHGKAYDNDASGWVRGMGGQAPHPKFDSGPSGHRYDRRK